ncbi:MULTISPECIES: acyl-CoA dehydrogenase family protein [Marinomonas]|uniref:Alkylation response protein AidB-like acyl-CoA dehydrogenase n=1 Tax=Marinomonas balearica TaxID=491947 RepID=A0A4R6M643_9GAMM|nr:MULTISPECIES: acyl-CoA dehydrogenase family protein [Marinomonas]TDO95499.1 alkylation response protein AidB-like acyl-CoA dehydrogenase [Marinomonas balearica]WCN10766.1 flavin-dependent monooxygenase [Marinomonas mediterranea]WCN14823.1 flavin-dependent monooxygenase [Marinomonas mediterranea]
MMPAYESAQRSTIYDALGTSEFQQLLSEISERARANEFDEQTFISQDIIDKFKAFGLYRALVPKSLGGDELTAAQFCKVIEEISKADGSAGWVGSFAMGIVYLSALPLETLKKVYAKTPDLVFAGGIFPPQAADVSEEGFAVKGRWKFSSGCMGADVVGVGIAPKEGDKVGLPRMAVMSADKVSIDKTWNTVGMAGTGSHDLVVDNVTVPEDWSFVRGGASNLTENMFRYPSLSFATQVLAVVGLGVARAALDELQAMAAGRASVTGAPNMGQRPLTQVEVAKAEAELRAARSFFYESIDDAWASLEEGGEVSKEQTNLLRLSSTHLTRVAADVARKVQMLSGMTGIYKASPLARFVNDAQVVTQHAFMGDITWQNAGAIFFGQDPLPGYL